MFYDTSKDFTAMTLTKVVSIKLDRTIIHI